MGQILDLVGPGNLTTKKIFPTYSHGKNARKRSNRPGIVGRMEKLGRRRKPEVRGGFSHHLATSRVQQSDLDNPNPTKADRNAEGGAKFTIRFCDQILFPLGFCTPSALWSALVGFGFAWSGYCTLEVAK